MKLTKILLFVAVVAMVFSACTVQKRVHRKGYHIEWFSQKPNVEKYDADQDVTRDQVAEVREEARNESQEVVAAEPVAAEAVVAPEASADMVAVESFDNAVVEEVAEEEVFYSDDSTYLDDEESDDVEESTDAQETSSGKSQLITLLLCLFIGGIGAHRFYLGYIGIGIIFLLTGGGCGIWWLIDLIRIITQDLQPKDGRYSETFN